MAGDFDLHQLLAGPIIAMNDAQGAAAASFYELFEQFAFEAADPAAAQPRQLRMLDFVAERATAEGIERRHISLPLLQMIPIGGVGIESAKIEFTLAVNAEPAARATPTGARQRAMTVPVSRTASASEPAPMALRARIAPTGAVEPGTPAGNLKVEIQLRQIDLPAGLLDMIAETQGGMSRRAPAAAPPAPPPRPPPPSPPTEEMPLFTAAIRRTSARAITPGDDFGFALWIEPNPGLIGSAQLQISLASEPRRALEILRPEGAIRIGREPVEVGVSVFVTEAVAKYSERTNVTLSVVGTGVGPDGAALRHRTSILLPRKSSAKR